MTDLLFDNLNVLKTDLTEAYNTYGSLKNIPVKLDDIVLDYLIYAYVMGVEDVNETFGTDTEISADDVERVVYEKVADKDFRQRVDEYVEENGTVDDLIRVAETDTIRIYNKASLETATKAGATQKTWVAVMDEKTRETHSYLDGVTVPIGSRFYTFDGDSADAPGGFTLASNNCNCRCVLLYS